MQAKPQYILTYSKAIKMRNLVLIIVLILNSFQANSQDIEKHPASLSSPGLKYDLDKSNAALGISSGVLSSLAALEKPPLNIAVFGVDRRDNKVYGNADMIMIISLDQVTKQIKLSSILRDTYVNINGLGMDKINAAFATGGPQMAIRALNENFSMDIRDFLSLDFFGSAKIIDALGGVTITVKKEEIPNLNRYLKEIGPAELMASDEIQHEGLQKLNGRQAVAYTRIRYVGNADYERTERQRKVMSALLENVRTFNSEALPALAMQIFPYMVTSIPPLTLFKLGSDFSNSKSIRLEPAMFPLAKESKGVFIDGLWYLSADLKATTNSLHNFIYKNIKP